MLMRKAEVNDSFITKILTGNNVLRAAIARIEWVFETFPSVCLSFSGGKDSTVLFHLVAGVARRKKRRFSVLFIDWEAQYRKRKLTAVCSHQTRIGNLDAHLI